LATFRLVACLEKGYQDYGMDSVSIALATYNGTRFLREQLASYENQELLPTELVVSDDGSDDDTVGMISNFAKSAPFPVRILPRQGRLGFADNFFRAARACTSEFVAFSDQDDVWLPRKLEEGVRRLKQDKSLLSMHTSTLTDASLAPKGLLRQGIRSSRVLEPLQLDPYFTGGWGNTMVFNRNLLDVAPTACRPREIEVDRPLLHDRWIHTLAAALGRVSHIDDPLCMYRQHTTNAIGLAKRGLAEHMRALSSVPLVLHRRRVEFYQAMELIFDDLQSSPNTVWAKAAAPAAKRYRERSMQLEARIGIYTGATISDRLDEFWKASRLHHADPALGRGSTTLSQMKDLILGVCGFGRVV
jgi:glycosyltransferase involved in cell wall biosynthesis